jgi:hypothetical protein
MAKNILGEVRDQSLHFSYCFALAFVHMFGRVNVWAIPAVFVTVYGIAMLREWYQHNGRLVWFSLDLWFSGAGAVAGIVVSFLI